MEYVRLSVLDNHKLQIDSVGILTRKTTMGTSMAPEMVLKPKEELQCFLYMGSSDGCVTQFTCNIAAPSSCAAASAAAAAAPSTSAAPITSYRVVASQTQKRKIIDGSLGSVPFLYVDDQLREPRVIVLCNGKITMLHYNSLDPLPAFQAVKALEGATACCVGKGFSDGRRLAAAVKRQLVLVEYSETSCSPVVTTGAANQQPLMLPENIQQMELHHNVLICGTKREYTLYDVRTHHVVDQVVVEKLTLGAAIRYLPNYHSGTLAIRLGTDSVVSYDGRQRKPVDAQARIAFCEPGVIDVAHCHPFLIGIKADGKVLLRSTVDDDEVPDAGITLPGGACRSHASCPLLTVVASGLHLGALVCTPPLVTVAQYILAGAYDRAIRHYEYLFDGPTTTTDATPNNVNSNAGDHLLLPFAEGLKRIRHACGVHALKNKRYSESFRSFELAETPVENVARAVVELRRPSGKPHESSAAEMFSSPGDLFRFLTAPGSVKLVVPLVSIAGSASGALSSGTALLEAPSQPEVLAVYQELFSFLRKHRVVSSLEATEDQRDLDFALFVLMLYGKAEHNEDDLNELFLPVCNLEGDACIALVQRRQQQLQQQQNSSTAADSEAPRHDPGQSLTLSLMSLLLASSGRYSEALAQCRERKLVAEAIVPLQLSGELSLYLEHLPWMLEANPVTAIRVLTTSSSSSVAIGGGAGVRPPPSVDAMLPLVLPYSGVTLATFLDHAIVRLRSRDPHIHTMHALNYIDTIHELRSYGLNGFSSASKPGGDGNALCVAAGNESGFLGDIRRKLLMFLSSSVLYDVDVVVGNLRKVGGLEDELVAAYRACGEHDLALQTLVYALHDLPAAVQYCTDVQVGRPYNWARDQRGGGGSGNVPHSASIMMDNASFGSQSSTPQPGSGFGSGADWQRSSAPGAIGSGDSTLPKALLGGSSLPSRQFSDALLAGGGGDLNSSHHGYPSNDTLNTLLTVLLVPPKGEAQRMDEAITLLRHHAQDMDPLSVLESLPGDVQFCEVSRYLVSTFRSMDQRRLISTFAAEAAASENTNTQRERMVLLQRCIYIDDDRPCVVCKKRVGDAVFGVFPNLKVAHFRCFKDRDVDPERGTPFVGWIS